VSIFLGRVSNGQYIGFQLGHPWPQPIRFAIVFERTHFNRIEKSRASRGFHQMSPRNQNAKPNGDGIWAFVADGYVDSRGPDRTNASPVVVFGDYFRVLRIPLLAGRYFTQAITPAPSSSYACANARRIAWFHDCLNCCTRLVPAAIISNP
jgi:hypothetical protein